MDSNTDHVAIPQSRTIRDKDGKATIGVDPEGYPLTAVCLTCGQPVTLPHWYAADWQHDA
jgi:hypothetical protein